MGPSPSDAELIKQSMGGDDHAFIAVIRRHADGVSRYLIRRAGPQDAEDLLGEVWVAAVRARASYDSSYPDARPWLFGIARNILRNHRRRRQASGEAPEQNLFCLVDPWPDVDQTLDGARLLREAITHMSPAERDVLVLVAWEGLTVAEAGRALGMPAGTARYRLHRARLALQQAPGIDHLRRAVDLTIKEGC